MAKTVRQKEINFLTVLEGRRAKRRLDPRALVMPGVVVLILLAGIGIAVLLYLNTSQVNEESDAIRAYLNAPDTNRQLSEAADIGAQAQAMANRAEGVATPMENSGTYPDLTSEDYRRISDYAGVNIELYTMSYDRSTGILKFTATSSYVSSIPTFISQLRGSGIFTDVSYSGYAGNLSASLQLSNTTSRSASASSAVGTSTTDASMPTYAFSVECSVKAPEASVEASATETEEH